MGHDTNGARREMRLPTRSEESRRAMETHRCKMIVGRMWSKMLMVGCAVVFVFSPARLLATLPCDELTHASQHAGCPEGMVIDEAGAVDGWKVWVGRVCLPTTLTDVTRLLLDDAGMCQWRDCESLCLVSATKSRTGDVAHLTAKQCNQTTFMTLERKLLAVIPIRIGSLTDRVVHHDAGRLTVGYSASAGSSGTRYGVPVVRRSHAVFTAEAVAENRVLIQYCQWAVPPPVLGMVSTSIGNRAAKKDVGKTLRSMQEALRGPRPSEAPDPPYLACIESRAPVCPAE